MEGVHEFIFVGLDSLSVDLVCPASVVSDGSNGSSDIRVLCPLESFACDMRAHRQVPEVSSVEG